MPLHPKAKDIASNVAYEWKMFDWSYCQLEQMLPRDSNDDTTASSIDGKDESGSHLIHLEVASGPEKDPRGNALLEVFLLHARVLRDFLSKSNAKARDDDVLAEHFEPENWQPIALPTTLDAERKRLDKALAHLSFKRIEYTEKWNLTRIYDELSSMWNTFFTSLPDDRRKWFDLNEDGWHVW